MKKLFYEHNALRSVSFWLSLLESSDILTLTTPESLKRDSRKVINYSFLIEVITYF